MKSGSDNHKDSIPILSFRLKTAITKSLEILGEEAVIGILFRLESHGIDLSDAATSYSLKQLEPIFKNIFGQDFTLIILDRITQQLDEHEE